MPPQPCLSLSHRCKMRCVWTVLDAVGESEADARRPHDLQGWRAVVVVNALAGSRTRFSGIDTGGFLVALTVRHHPPYRSPQPCQPFRFPACVQVRRRCQWTAPHLPGEPRCRSVNLCVRAVVADVAEFGGGHASDPEMTKAAVVDPLPAAKRDKWKDRRGLISQIGISVCFPALSMHT